MRNKRSTQPTSARLSITAPAGKIASAFMVTTLIHSVSSAVALSEAKELISTNKIPEAHSKLVALKSPHFLWENDSMERGWMEILVLSKGCDTKEFESSRLDFTRRFSPWIEQFPIYRPSAQDRLLIHNLISIPDFKSLLDVYNRSLNSDVNNNDSSKTIHNLKGGYSRQMFYKKVLAALVIEFQHPLTEWLWALYHQALTFEPPRLIPGTASDSSEAKALKVERTGTILWPLSSEWWADELEYLQPAATNSCKYSATNWPPFLENPSLDKAALDLIDEIFSMANQNRPLSEFLRKAEESFERSSPNEGFSLLALREMSLLWNLISTSDLEPDEKKRLLTLWEARTRNMVTEEHRRTLTLKLPLDSVIKAYNIYLGFIRPTSYEMTMTKQLARSYESAKSYYLAGIHFYQAFGYRKDLPLINSAIDCFFKELDKPQSLFTKTMTLNSLKLTHQELISLDPKNPRVDKIAKAIGSTLVTPSLLRPEPSSTH